MNRPEFEYKIRLKLTDAELLKELARQQGSEPRVVIAEVVEVYLAEKRKG